MFMMVKMPFLLVEYVTVLCERVSSMFTISAV